MLLHFEFLTLCHFNLLNWSVLPATCFTFMALVFSIVNKRTVLENVENISPVLLVHIRGLHMFDMKNEHG